MKTTILAALALAAILTSSAIAASHDTSGWIVAADQDPMISEQQISPYLPRISAKGVKCEPTKLVAPRTASQRAADLFNAAPSAPARSVRQARATYAAPQVGPQTWAKKNAQTRAAKIEAKRVYDAGANDRAYQESMAAHAESSRAWGRYLDAKTEKINHFW